jgi:hypothetical protein
MPSKQILRFAAVQLFGRAKGNRLHHVHSYFLVFVLYALR